MKTLLITILAVSFLLSCNKDDDKPIAEIDKLPPATQTGANTAGCLVNGEAFLPKGNVQGGNLVLNYFGTDFTFKIAQKRLNEPLKSIGIILEQLEAPLEINQLIILNTEIETLPTRTGIYMFDGTPPPSPLFHQTTPHIKGELLITHHDFDNAILSGTFWFDAINSEGEIVEIREGRFDVQY